MMPCVNRMYVPMNAPTASARTSIDMMRDVLSLFLIAGRKNQIPRGISRTPMMPQITPSTLLTVLIRSIIRYVNRLQAN